MRHHDAAFLTEFRVGSIVTDSCSLQISCHDDLSLVVSKCKQSGPYHLIWQGAAGACIVTVMLCWAS